MRIQAKAETETIEPDWLGNLELPENERVRVTFKLLTVGDQAKENARAISRATRRNAKIGQVAANAPYRLIASHVLKVENLHVVSVAGEETSPKTGAELAELIRTQPGEETWSTLTDVLLSAIKGASELGDDLGNGSASSPDS